MTTGHIRPLERSITFEPAYDKSDPVPAKNYGIHSVTLRMVLKGPKGAIQFVLYTGWFLPKNKASQVKLADLHPMPVDLGYHAYKPIRDWQQIEVPTFKSCEYLGGKPCWYDGSTLNAQPIYDKLVAEGDEAVWLALESYYEKVFEWARDLEFGGALGGVNEVNEHDHDQMDAG